jgi:hypothetical protein
MALRKIFEHNDEGLACESLWTDGFLRVRVRIRRNSFAVAEVFSDASLQWNRLASIPPPLMHSDEADENALIMQVNAILGNGS